MREIAKDAWLFGYPRVMGYRALYNYALDETGPEFKAPFNVIKNIARVYTPEDAAFGAPNSDTPYSWAWLDLRAEPVVLTLPAIEPGRYYSVQLVDLQTYNFAWLGTRTTGNTGGNFMIAGPDWTGDTPDGVTSIIRSETTFAFAIFRTQLFEPGDLENVKRIQAGYELKPLSSFLEIEMPLPPPSVDWPVPTDDMLEGTAMFQYVDFLLSLSPVHPADRPMLERFRRLGILTGEDSSLEPELEELLLQGKADAESAFAALRERVDSGEVTSADLYGSREQMQGKLLERYAGARFGLYGASAEEAFYPAYYVDEDGAALDGSKHKYALRFEPGALPPVRAFWSVTVYDARTRQLVPNPIDRYLVNSAMLNSFHFDEHGTLVFYLQHENPGPQRQANWLPVPHGPFYVVMRLFLPEPAVLDRTWQQPPLRKVK